MLDKQIHMYSVDTGHFYSNHEKYLHDMNCKYRKERNYIKNKLPSIEKKLSDYGFSSTDINNLKLNKIEKIKVDITDEMRDTVQEYIYWNTLIRHKRQKAKESKDKILTLLSNKVEQNIKSKGKDHIRVLRENDLKKSDIISVFESSLTRTIGIETDAHTDDLITVQVYYFDVFKDISYYGFKYKGENYRYFTSSAGQIRKKKAVFIKETVWEKVEKTIMCGLTIAKINSKGGNNVNKHLAYMALSNSATDLWEEFDIDKCIVIDDFETNVYGTFDFIDDKDYSITRKTDYIPIPHTDGSGMMLPSVMSKNTMVRLPWIKGLLGVFDYKKFIEINDYSPIISDIYGKEWNIIEDDIQIIFTKSQFKMYKYYDSWEEYKTYFKQYKCQACLCNTEETRIKNAKINYQMLQTLTDIADEEIDILTNKSVDRITNVCSSVETMMDILGITPYNEKMTPFQKSVKIYPALLNDTYAKDVIREVKDSLLKKYRSGKLEINGKYTFLLPDFYAACEYWFGKIDNPKGLLEDQEVFCWLFRKSEKLDCLRSPHLYKEHAIRRNVAYDSYGDRKEKIREWFCTNAVYTSTHDFISKILQFDVDGDKSLVVADSDFIRVAERNMQGIVPLYYNMAKAKPTELNNENIYKGLNDAFVGGNIGLYSNDISKIWNNDVFIDGTDEEKNHAIDCVKRLCCQNNFVIDYAKTLYKPDFPKHINEEIKAFTNQKLPTFFEFAKNKEESQVTKRNNSFVNKLYSKIPNKAINTRNLKIDKLDWTKLVSDPHIICTKEVSDLYDKISREYSFQVNMKDEYIDNLRYLACDIRSRFNELGYSDETISDMLVKKIYGNNSRRKQILWFCYGQQILDNLQSNIDVPKTKVIQCVDCGEWFEVNSNSKKIRCVKCEKLERQRINRNNYKKRKNSD